MKLGLTFFIIILMTLTIFTKPRQVSNIHKPFRTHVHRTAHVMSVVGTHSHVHAHHPVHPHLHVAHSHGVHSHLIHHSTPLSHYHVSAQNYIQVARLAYCPKKLILAKRCQVCHFIFNNYKTFFIHTVNQNKKKLFQFVILYSDIKKEILITFSGPKTDQGKFFNKVYKKGFITVKELGNKVKVENYYWEIYSKYMRSVLHKKMKKIMKKSKRNNYKVVFTGHSFGGCLAVLAAYDLVKQNIVRKNTAINSPITFTFGQLRIGDNFFVAAVNKNIKVIRFLRSDDFVTRVPSCVYDPSVGLFKCYRRVASVIKNYPIFRKYFVIYRHGIKLYRKTIIKRFHVTKKTQIHYHSYYSQPLGTIIYYQGNNFGRYQLCAYKNGIPICEQRITLPNTFSPIAHRHYFGVNVEAC